MTSILRKKFKIIGARYLRKPKKRITDQTSDNNGRMVLASITSSFLHYAKTLPSLEVYLVVALMVFTEAPLFLGFILPGETAVLVAGVVASQGKVQISVLVPLVVLCAITGDNLGYLVGNRFGPRLLAFPVLQKRHSAVDKALDHLARRGAVYVFSGRFTAFLRAVMPALAGLSSIPYRRFALANALACITWGVGFPLLGYYAGGQLPRIEKSASWVGYAILSLIIALIARHIVRARRERQA